MVIFQEVEETPEVYPLSGRLDDLVGQALETKDNLIHYLSDTAQEARKVALSTVHYLKSTLGMQ
jgi:hypothetical protein